MEKRYEFLEHTADAKFRAYGKTLEEAFANAAIATFAIMTDTEKVERKVKKGIAVKGDDLQSLLVAFLEEFIFMLDAENFLLHSVENVKIQKKGSSCELTADATGDFYAEKYETHGDVKAITYNDMRVVEKKEECMVQVVVDI